MVLPLPVNPGWQAPKKEAAPFSLDNTRAGALTLAFASSPSAEFDGLRPGGTLSYTFWERFLPRGSIFIAPNAWFVAFQAGTARITSREESRDFFRFIPGIGAQWKFRPDASERFLLWAGLSADLLLGSLSYRYYDQGFKEVSDFLVEPLAGFHGGLGFRITPLAALEFSLAYYLDALGAYPLADGSTQSLNFFQGTLGASIMLPYRR